MNVIELEEEQNCSISPADLTEATAKLIVELPGGPIDLQPPSFLNDRQYVLRSTGCVGVIPIDEAITLRISPKIPIPNVFRMLEYAYDLKSFSILAGQNLSGSLQEVFETLALILARRVLERVRKGLHRGYVEDQDSLVVPRGRILLEQSIRARLRGSVRLECLFEEHTADLEDNLILAWTLRQVSRLPLERYETRRAVREAYRALSTSIEVRPVSAVACIDRFYDRLNDDYRPMHGLCRFFLEHCGPALSKGDRDFLPFRLEMPALFETFVERWLRANLPDGLRLKSQFQARLDENGHYSFKIDLVVSESATGKVVAVLDTKYKRDPKPSPDDLQQIIAYASRMETTRGFLIYPSFATEVLELRWTGPVKIRSVVFDLAADSEVAGQHFLKEVLKDLG